MKDSVDHRANPDPLSAVGRFFRDHPAILATAVYIQVSAVGVVFDWRLYSYFGINIFDFAESNDFLLAAFKEPFAFIMALLTCGGFLLYAVLVRFFSKRLVFSRSVSRLRVLRRLQVFLLLMVIPYTLSPAMVYSRRAAKNILDNPGSLVCVKIQHRPGQVPSSCPDTVRIIGTTERFAFFFDDRSTETFAIPVANILEVRFPAPRTGLFGDLSVEQEESPPAGDTESTQTTRGRPPAMPDALILRGEADSTDIDR